MKKIHNDGLQILGIIVSVLGFSGIVRPLITAIFSKEIIFKFFGLLGDGIPSLIIWVIVLLVGLVLVSITEPLNNK